MNKLIKIICVTRCIYYLYKSESKIKEDKYEDALGWIDKINLKWVNEGFFRYNLYRGYILYELRKIDESILCFKKAINDINLALNKSMIKNNEADYLKEYALDFISFMYKQLNQMNESKTYNLKISKLSYDISEVRDTIFENFPFRDKKEWIEENNKRKQH